MTVSNVDGRIRITVENPGPITDRTLDERVSKVVETKLDNINQTFNQYKQEHIAEEQSHQSTFNAAERDRESEFAAAQQERQEAFQGAQSERETAFAAGMAGYTQQVNAEAQKATQAAQAANNAADSLAQRVEAGEFNGKNGRTPIISAVPSEDGSIITVDGKPIAKVTNGSDATATDVQINGTSITEGGVANIPIAAITQPIETEITDLKEFFRQCYLELKELILNGSDPSVIVARLDQAILDLARLG